MIKNLLYVEDGSVDVDALKLALTDETLIVPYRAGSAIPVLVTPREPLASASFDFFEEYCNRVELSFYAMSKVTPTMAENLIKIGETRTIELKDGKKAVVEVIGINHDEREDGSISPVTFGFRDLFGTAAEGGIEMNEEFTDTWGWEMSKIRAWLNKDFLELLPDDLARLIKPVKKMTSTGVDGKVEAIYNKIFIPSESEVYGRCELSKKFEGEQYEFFKDWRNRIKGFLDSCYGRWWWLRSPYSGDDRYLCVVRNCGNVDSSYGCHKYGVSPCFAL